MPPIYVTGQVPSIPYGYTDPELLKFQIMQSRELSSSLHARASAERTQQMNVISQQVGQGFSQLQSGLMQLQTNIQETGRVVTQMQNNMMQLQAEVQATCRAVAEMRATMAQLQTEMQEFAQFKAAPSPAPRAQSRRRARTQPAPQALDAAAAEKSSAKKKRKQTEPPAAGQEPSVSLTASSLDTPSSRFSSSSSASFLAPPSLNLFACLEDPVSPSKKRCIESAISPGGDSY